MEKNNIDDLVEQIKCIILNKPISDNIRVGNDEVEDLQKAIDYLSGCISEVYDFIMHLSRGELDITPPSRYNFFAGSLKELHSDLRHLTWQANQIANGDYTQKVSFLGDFSVAFNQMVKQLKEREIKLKEQSEILSQHSRQMMDIMDGVKDWIVVTSEEAEDILYKNSAANELFLNMSEENLCIFLDFLRCSIENHEKERLCELIVAAKTKIYSVKTSKIYWKESYAFVHYISDITKQKEEHKKISKMAYKDELTGLYNRRYCYIKLRDFLAEKTAFTFCLIDLDKLKYANDNYGHASGDEYLKIVSKEIKKIIRASDISCRLGGDEFVIMFLDCHEEIVLEKLKMVDNKLAMKQKTYPMSISYGTVYVDINSNMSIQEVIDMADEKMYEMKRAKKFYIA